MEEAFALAAEMLPASSYFLSGIPGAMYYAYYYKNYCGQVPEMYGGEGPFLELLKANCPIFKEEYRPPPLMHESRLMTIVASLGRHRGLTYPYMREVFKTDDGGELALDWWDSRLKPKSAALVPVIPSTTLIDSLSYYYHNISIPHIRFPQIQIPQIPQMRIPQIQIPYFRPLKRSASATGNEFTVLDARAAEVERLEREAALVDCQSSPDTDLSHRDTINSDEGVGYGSPRSCSSPDAEMDELNFTHSDVPDLEEAALPDQGGSPAAFYDADLIEEELDGVTHSKHEPTEVLHEEILTESATVPEPKGIVLVLPGLTGDSTRNYVLGLVREVEQLGYTAVVMNYRGVTGNMKACFMADTSDVAQIIRHLKDRYPTIPLVAIGVSLGGILLTNYVAQCGLKNEDSLLLGVMTVSVAWNFFESAKEMEQPLNWLLFNRMLTRALCEAVDKHSEVLRTVYDLEGVQEAKSLRELDDMLTSKMFGFTSADEYYKNLTLHDKVAHIKTPVLAINAADDMFSPYHGIPKEEAKRNPNLCIIVTSHGGHIGFLEGRDPFGTNYVERVFRQYGKALFDNKDKTIASPIPDEAPIPMPPDLNPSDGGDLSSSVAPPVKLTSESAESTAAGGSPLLSDLALKIAGE